MRNTSVKVAVLPMAGRGTRLYPLTKVIPKQILPIIDKPVVGYILTRLINAGINEFILVVAPEAWEIKRYIAEVFLPEVGSAVKVTYIEQEQPLGLADAILCAKEAINNRPFAVVLPDIVFNPIEQSYMKLLLNHFETSPGNYVGVSVIAEEDISKYGIIKYHSDNGALQIDQIYEKPPLKEAPSNMGVIGRYIFLPEFLQTLSEVQFEPTEEKQLTWAINEFIQRQSVYAWLFPGEHFDCGSFEGYFDAIIHIGYQHPKFREVLRKYLEHLLKFR